MLDRTVTAMGSRLMSDWVANPLTDIGRDRCAGSMPWPNCWRNRLWRPGCANRSRACSTSNDCWPAYDGPGQPARFELPGPHAALLPALKARLTARKSARLNALEAELDLCPELRARLDAALAEDCRW